MRLRKEGSLLESYSLNREQKLSEITTNLVGKRLRT